MSKKLLIFLILLSIFYLIIFFNLGGLKIFLLNYYEYLVSTNNKKILIFFFVFFYSFSILCLLPLGLFFIPLAGALFGMWYGFLLNIISIMLGLISIYLVVKFKINIYFINKININFKKIKPFLDNNELSSLLMIRLIGVIPFSMQNLISAYISNNFYFFIIVPIFVMSPWILSLSYLGSKFELSLNFIEINFIDILKKDIFFILVILFYIIIFYFSLKAIKRNYTNLRLK